MGRLGRWAAAGILAATVAAAAPAQEVGRSTLTMKPHEDLTEGALEILNRRCTVCHTAEKFGARHFTREQWDAVIRDMVKRGAQLSPAEAEALGQGWKGK
ncbi:MAG: hypothetical protein ACYDA8_21645 [Deferrisomatales bacterium]